MKKFIIKRKKKTNECDAVDGGGASYDYAANLGFGMGEVNPIGGPDKFGEIIGAKSFQRKKRKYKVKRRK